MLYITVEGNKIGKIYCSPSLEKMRSYIPNADIREVPETFNGIDGEDITLFDAEWERIPVIAPEEAPTEPTEAENV